jgi:glutaredoxin 3
MGQDARVVMYSTAQCGYCVAARMLLTKKGIAFEDIPVGDDVEKRLEMERLSGRRTVPQIFVDGQPIGGFEELHSLDRQGRLDELLGRSQQSAQPGR